MKRELGYRTLGVTIFTWIAALFCCGTWYTFSKKIAPSENPVRVSMTRNQDLDSLENKYVDVVDFSISRGRVIAGTGNLNAGYSSDRKLTVRVLSSYGIDLANMPVLVSFPASTQWELDAALSNPSLCGWVQIYNHEIEPAELSALRIPTGTQRYARIQLAAQSDALRQRDWGRRWAINLGAIGLAALLLYNLRAWRWRRLGIPH